VIGIRNWHASPAKPTHLELIVGAEKVVYPRSAIVCSTAFVSRRLLARGSEIWFTEAVVHALRNQTPGLG
jgi:hypothetical protein